MFLDADLVGLRPDHVDALVTAVVAAARPTWPAACSTGARWPTASSCARLPVLTGQRALRRELFDRLTPGRGRGYRVEAALNSLVARDRLIRHDRVLDGLWHRTKEEKAAHPVLGFARKVAMLAEACCHLRPLPPGAGRSVPGMGLGRRPRAASRGAS